MNKTLKKILWVLCIVAATLLVEVVGFLIFFMTREEMTSYVGNNAFSDVTTYVDDMTTDYIGDTMTSTGDVAANVGEATTDSP